MVVWYGKSTIPDNDVSVFGFTKLLTYDAYLGLTADANGYKTVECSFLTNKAVSGTTTVYISNPYFVQATATFPQ